MDILRRSMVMTPPPPAHDTPRTVSKEGAGRLVDGEEELEEECEGYGEEAEEDGPGPEVHGQGRCLDELAPELDHHQLPGGGDA